MHACLKTVEKELFLKAQLQHILIEAEYFIGNTLIITSTTESQTRGRCGAGGSSLFVFFLDYKYTYRVYGIWARGHFSHQMNNCYPQLKQRPLKALQPLCLNINNALTTNLPPGPRKHQMGA